MLEFTKKIFRNAILKNRKTAQFYVTYGIFLIKRLQNIMAAYYYLNVALELGCEIG
jgi:hypothetical protein